MIHLLFSSLTVNFTPILFVTVSQYFSTSFFSIPSITAIALSGITFTLTPEFTDIILGSVLSSLKSAIKLAFNPPFSTLITGKSASGEKVIGASFSIL